MNRAARCSRCGQSYCVRSFAEKHDPGRLCDRCYIDRTQPPMDLFNPSPEAPANYPGGPSFPAAGAAGLSESKE